MKKITLILMLMAILPNVVTQTEDKAHDKGYKSNLHGFHSQETWFGKYSDNSAAGEGDCKIVLTEKADHSGMGVLLVVTVEKKSCNEVISKEVFNGHIGGSVERYSPAYSKIVEHGYAKAYEVMLTQREYACQEGVSFTGTSFTAEEWISLSEQSCRSRARAIATEAFNVKQKNLNLQEQAKLKDRTYLEKSFEYIVTHKLLVTGITTLTIATIVAGVYGYKYFTTPTEETSEEVVTEEENN